MLGEITNNEFFMGIDHRDFTSGVLRRYSSNEEGITSYGFINLMTNGDHIS